MRTLFQSGSLQSKGTEADEPVLGAGTFHCDILTPPLCCAYLLDTIYSTFYSTCPTSRQSQICFDALGYHCSPWSTDEPFNIHEKCPGTTALPLLSVFL